MPDPPGGGVEGNDHVHFVDSRQAYQRIAAGDALGFQTGLAGAVTLHDTGIGQHGGQLAAPGGVLLDELHVDPVLFQHFGQIVADPATAAEDDPPDPPGQDPQIFQQLRQVGGGGGDEDAVSFPQDEVAAGDGCAAGAQHGADQDLALDDAVHFNKAHVAQFAAGIHPQFDNFRPALGKGIPAQEAGVFQQPLDFRGGLIFRVHGHGKAEGLPHGKNLVGIFRVADTGDGM